MADEQDDRKVIVLVDGEESIHILYGEVLEDAFDETVKVISFQGAEPALEFMAANRIDLVISCINMPGMNGIDFLIQSKKLYPQIPFIIHTAYQEFKRDSAAWPLDAYVQKSSDPERLLTEIEQLLGLKREWETNESYFEEKKKVWRQFWGKK